jgi:hypothetical protein
MDLEQTVNQLTWALHTYHETKAALQADQDHSGSYKTRALTQLEAETRTAAETLVKSFWGRVSEPGGVLEGGHFWGELDNARAALSDAQAGADTLDQVKLQNTLAMMDSILVGLRTLGEVEHSYQNTTNPYVKRAWQMLGPAKLHAKFGAAAGVGSLLAKLETDYNASLETDQVKTAQGRLHQLNQMGHHAMDMLRTAEQTFGVQTTGPVADVLRRVRAPNKYTGAGQWTRLDPYQAIREATEGFMQQAPK